MLGATALLTVLSTLITSHNWRLGLYSLIIVGVLQDVFRKMTPGVPSYYVLWAGVIFAIVLFFAYSRGAIRDLNVLYLRDRNLRLPWTVFFFLVLLQAGHAFLRWQTPVLPILGIVTFFLPIAALLIGATYAQSEKLIRQFLIGYACIISPAVATVYLSVWYSDAWPILREIGSFVGHELVIYDLGTMLVSYSGLFRVGEIAAWHAATAVAFLIILSRRKQSIAYRVLIAAVIVLLIGAIVLTGRRKMLMTISIFLVVQLSLFLYFRHNSGRQAAVLLFLGTIGSFAWILLDEQSTTALYLQRGLTVFEDAAGRFNQAIDLLNVSIQRAGILGFGAGTTAQGSQYFHSLVFRGGGAAEAGIGKIVAELGIPGIFVVFWLVARIAIRVFAGLRVLSIANPDMFYYAASLSSLLFANAVTFFVATQVYGDIFVLIILGLTGGFLFSIIYWDKEFLRTRVTGAAPIVRHGYERA